MAPTACRKYEEAGLISQLGSASTGARIMVSGAGLRVDKWRIKTSGPMKKPYVLYGKEDISHFPLTCNQLQKIRGSPYKRRETAYITLTRSQLEYCSSIWDPILII